MMNAHKRLTGSRSSMLERAFTLIELLTVVAIIALLISILVPSLSRARDQAKRARGLALLKSAGDGLEMFRNDNEDELKGNNYPPSTAGDDPTDPADHTAFGSSDIFGGQWLVRYLMGKDRNGYIAKKSVPTNLFGQNTYNEQVGWYDNTALSRSGPYMNDAPTKAPKDLPGSPVSKADTSAKYNNPVFVDSFGMPVLYYAANSRYSARPDANPTTYKGPPTDYSGVFNFLDNALFTGMCTEQACDVNFQWWDFGGGEPKLNYGPASWTGARPPDWGTELLGHPDSFASHILADKSTRPSTSPLRLNSVAPMKRESFLLWTPGKDGLFGTTDDVMNFGQ